MLAVDTQKKTFYLWPTTCWDGRPGFAWAVDEQKGPWLSTDGMIATHRGGRISWHNRGDAINYAMRCGFAPYSVEMPEEFPEWDDHGS